LGKFERIRLEALLSMGVPSSCAQGEKHEGDGGAGEKPIEREGGGR